MRLFEHVNVIVDKKIENTSENILKVVNSRSTINGMKLQ